MSMILTKNSVLFIGERDLVAIIEYREIISKYGKISF